MRVSHAKNDGKDYPRRPSQTSSNNPNDGKNYSRHPSQTSNNNPNSSSVTNSLTKGLARWTKRMSGIASCGAITQLPSEDKSDTSVIPSDYQSSWMGPSISQDHSSGNSIHSGKTTGSTIKKSESEHSGSHMHSASSSIAHNNSRINHQSTTASERPQRKYKKTSHNNEDYDHHTLGTATTASATISYTTSDAADASIASEVGMEVVMAASESRDAPEDHRLASTDSFGSKHSQGRSNRSPAPSYSSHSFQAGKHLFTVDRRYSMIRVIGSGAYGVVISANDSKAQEGTNPSTCAIKMVPKAFSDEIDAKRILREIKLLKHFRHENIVGLTDMMPPNVPFLEDFQDVYFCTDLMETDLHRIIYSKQKLSIDHVQYFIYQVLRGLKYIHSAQVLHRDLKPSNLLVNSNCDLKICDFGLARGVDRRCVATDSNVAGGTMLLTEYVVTRWYRAPEIMLACHEYSFPVDVWSVGCIFAELLLRKPMFPGEDYIDQLTIISEKIGKLEDSDLNFVTSDKAKRFMKKLPKKKPVPFSVVFPEAPSDSLDALRKMLQIHPAKRTTVSEALKHPFFEALHNPEDEPSASSSFDFSFESEKLHRLKLQELIWKEVADFRPSCLPVAPSKQLRP